jgi:hypothetical protein
VRPLPIQVSGDYQKDIANLIKWLFDYWTALEQKGALSISEAEITVNQGLKFPPTQVASADVNTLDDYEEGTWVPADASGAGLALTINAATYTKIGRHVSCLCSVTYPATASGAAAAISGLPFTPANTNSAPFYSNGTGGGVVTQVSTTTLTFFAPGVVAISNANLSLKFVIVRFQFEI